MKQLFLFALVVAFASCNSKEEATTKSADEQQKNIEASRVVNKAFQSGDANSIDSVVADDFLNHTEHGDIKGRDSLKAMINMVHTTMKDMKTEVLNEAAGEDYVYTLMRFTGNSKGEMGMPVGPYDMKAIEVARFSNGKIVEHWEYDDMAEMMKMMNPAMNNMGGQKKDSMMKDSSMHK
jgi:predicted SnoaL-like aldol condensation-catalyzing enzyme